MIDQEKQLIVIQPDDVRLGSLQVSTPHAVVERASMVARELANIVDSRKLFTAISGKKFVRVEGWTTLGAMLGVVPREVNVKLLEDGETYEATVELVRVTDGQIIGRGSAICGIDEQTWAKRPRNARRSMSITRATGKAYRLTFSWIMTLAGYEATPAEEMDEIENEPTARPQTPVRIIEQVKQSPESTSRPLSSTVLVSTLNTKVAKFDRAIPEETLKKMRGLLAGTLNELVGSDDKRHWLLAALCPNSEGHTDKLTDAWVSTLLDWVGLESRMIEGRRQYAHGPNTDYARQEAETIIREYQTQHGQTTLTI